MSKAKFVIYADKAGKWRWKVVHANGQTTGCSGEAFDSMRNAMRAAVAFSNSIESDVMFETEDDLL